MKIRRCLMIAATASMIALPSCKGLFESEDESEVQNAGELSDTEKTGGLTLTVANAGGDSTSLALTGDASLVKVFRLVPDKIAAGNFETTENIENAGWQEVAEQEVEGSKYEIPNLPADAVLLTVTYDKSDEDKPMEMGLLPPLNENNNVDEKKAAIVLNDESAKQADLYAKAAPKFKEDPNLKDIVDTPIAFMEFAKLEQMLNLAEDRFAKENPDGTFPEDAQLAVLDNFTQDLSTRIKDLKTDDGYEAYVTITYEKLGEAYTNDDYLSKFNGDDFSAYENFEPFEIIQDATLDVVTELKEDGSLYATYDSYESDSSVWVEGLENTYEDINFDEAASGANFVFGGSAANLSEKELNDIKNIFIAGSEEDINSLNTQLEAYNTSYDNGEEPQTDLGSYASTLFETYENDPFFENQGPDCFQYDTSSAGSVPEECAAAACPDGNCDYDTHSSNHSDNETDTYNGGSNDPCMMDPNDPACTSSGG